jgi:thiol-disulfide isomerase/thioredoxin
MNKILIAALIIIILVIGGLVIFSGPSDIREGAPATPENLRPAPDFSLEDFSGSTVSLGDFSGKPIVLNSWAVWCPFCRKELVDFAAVKDEFGEQIEIIAIDRAESLDKAKKYTDELGVTNDLIFLLDPDDSFYRSIGGFSMPETIFVDREGNIRIHKRGPMDVDEIREKIQAIL